MVELLLLLLIIYLLSLSQSYFCVFLLIFILCQNFTNCVKDESLKAGEMAQCLRTLTALGEAMLSSKHPHLMTDNCLQFQAQGIQRPLVASIGHLHAQGAYKYVHTHSYTQKIKIFKIKI